MTTITMIDTTTLTPSEDIQSAAKVSEIADCYDEEPAWDEQPAIFVDTDGVIIDGHHRVAASIEAGLNTWRAIVVDRAHWEELHESLGYTMALAELCDEVDDCITWGHVTA